MLKDIVTYMAEDFLEVQRFIPQAAFLALIGTAGFTLILFLCRKQWKINRSAAFFVALFYTLFLLYVTVIGRKAGSDSHTAVSWAWYGTWFNPGHGKAYVIENCLMFVPFGFFGCMALPKKKDALVIAAALVMSVVTEYLQLRYRSGYCELSDVLQNTAGTVIGYAAAKVLLWMNEGR